MMTIPCRFSLFYYFAVIIVVLNKSTWKISAFLTQTLSFSRHNANIDHHRGATTTKTNYSFCPISTITTSTFLSRSINENNYEEATTTTMLLSDNDKETTITLKNNVLIQQQSEDSTTTTTKTLVNNDKEEEECNYINNIYEWDNDDDEEEANAKSAFGTKRYWDDVYTGCGDFNMNEYSWYYGWDEMKRYVQPYMKNNKNNDSILLPGIGNDPLLIDLIQSGYTNIYAQDYSKYAIDRQYDLLQYVNYDNNNNIQLFHSDVKQLPKLWTNKFNIILEKGLLDAVYLSGDGNVELAIESLTNTLQSNGIFISISGVIPNELRKSLFNNYEWIRDGSNDLKAGCFIFQKK